MSSPHCGRTVAVPLLLSSLLALAACGGGSSGSSTSPECATASDCPGADTECGVRSCAGGICGFSNADAGTPLAAQVAGDCRLATCDGAGATTAVADDADLPADVNECTADLCVAGAPQHASQPAGWPCAQNGGTLCDGSGACVACLAPTDCPAPGALCVSPSCVAGACGLVLDPAGTLVAGDVPGDCRTATVCDGAGAVFQPADDTDVPDDGNACTADTCASGVPQNAPLPAGSACAQGGGTVCDGSGACVECLSGSDCASGSCVSNVCRPAAGTVVVSQVYGGGGLSGAPYARDYVELHNRSAVTVSLAGWSVQYEPAAGTTWQAAALSGEIAPGGYYLVQLAGGATGLPLPAPDATGSLDLSITGGKVALVVSLAPLEGCPAPGGVMDLVGYGTASCAEGSAAPATTALLASTRRGAGCQDTGDNAADLELASPAPRTSASPAVACGAAANETGAPGEADACFLVASSFTVAAGQGTPNIYGQLYEAGLTETAGVPPGVLAELGYGPAGTDPRSAAGWTFLAASYDGQVGSNDEYRRTFPAPAPGVWSVAYRFSLDGTATWTYCDLDGAGASPGFVFEPAQLLEMTVTP